MTSMAASRAEATYLTWAEAVLYGDEGNIEYVVRQLVKMKSWIADDSDFPEDYVDVAHRLEQRIRQSGLVEIPHIESESEIDRGNYRVVVNKGAISEIRERYFNIDYPPGATGPVSKLAHLWDLACSYDDKLYQSYVAEEAARMLHGVHRRWRYIRGEEKQLASLVEKITEAGVAVASIYVPIVETEEEFEMKTKPMLLSQSGVQGHRYLLVESLVKGAGDSIMHAIGCFLQRLGARELEVEPYNLVERRLMEATIKGSELLHWGEYEKAKSEFLAFKETIDPAKGNQGFEFTDSILHLPKVEALRKSYTTSDESKADITKEPLAEAKAGIILSALREVWDEAGGEKDRVNAQWVRIYIAFRAFEIIEWDRRFHFSGEFMDSVRAFEHDIYSSGLSKETIFALKHVEERVLHTQL